MTGVRIGQIAQCYYYVTHLQQDTVIGLAYITCDWTCKQIDLLITVLGILLSLNVLKLTQLLSDIVGYTKERERVY